MYCIVDFAMHCSLSAECAKAAGKLLASADLLQKFTLQSGMLPAVSNVNVLIHQLVQCRCAGPTLQLGAAALNSAEPKLADSSSDAGAVEAKLAALSTSANADATNAVAAARSTNSSNAAAAAEADSKVISTDGSATYANAAADVEADLGVAESKYTVSDSPPPPPQRYIKKLHTSLQQQQQQQQQQHSPSSSSSSHIATLTAAAAVPPSRWWGLSSTDSSSSSSSGSSIALQQQQGAVVTRMPTCAVCLDRLDPYAVGIPAGRVKLYSDSNSSSISSGDSSTVILDESRPLLAAQGSLAMWEGSTCKYVRSSHILLQLVHTLWRCTT
jgi:hypothetical protein